MSDASGRHVQLRFQRPHLEDLPPLFPPDGYELRNYRPGDEVGWAAVLAAAFSEGDWTENGIEREFVDSPYFLPDRIFLAETEGRIVASAAAWERGIPDCGYVHWVGVDPAHQGRKLGRLVTLATLHRFRDEGKSSAMLDTDDFRTAACATYLNLGFLPTLDSPERQAMWDRVRASLGLDG